MAILIDMSEVTRILSQIDSGNSEGADELLPLVYEELRKLASVRLAKERPGQTLQATALVHEAYLRLVGGRESGVGSRESAENACRNEDGSPIPDSRFPAPSFSSRGHFFAAAAEAMRRILIEAARRKRRIVHGGGLQRIPLDEIEPAEQPANDDLLVLDESIARLEAHDPLAANVVKLRFFAGLTMAETAEALGMPLRTAERNWTYARTWLHRDLG